MVSARLWSKQHTFRSLVFTAACH